MMSPKKGSRQAMKQATTMKRVLADQAHHRVPEAPHRRQDVAELAVVGLEEWLAIHLHGHLHSQRLEMLG